MNELVKKRKLNENLEDLKKCIIEYEYKDEEIVTRYLELMPYRDEFLLLVKNSEYIDVGYKQIIKCMEELLESLRSQQNNYSKLKETLVHECFIYTVAYYLKTDNTNAI